MKKNFLQLFALLALAGAFLPAQTPKLPALATATHSALLDINTATPDQLRALPGIGEAYSKRIIAGRPYRMKNQLVSKGIIPQSTYDKIADRIIAAQPAQHK